MVNEFKFSRTPTIYFGAGTFSKLPDILAPFGSKILLIKGKSSFDKSTYYEEIKSKLAANNIDLYQISISSEPSPDFVDNTVKSFRRINIGAVVSIGGGSVIDCGKAVSAMLPCKESVRNYLEGMEASVHDGKKIPLIAVPTSSGTGAEATKNAVLSEVGTNGFKRSLRHDNFVPDIALVDPLLTMTCPKSVTASCGLDALTQLIEAYVSTNATYYTDGLALTGIREFASGFIDSYNDGSNNIAARSSMSYAALTSGIVLANAGLGSIHGIAGVVGGFFNIPHGVACGTLLSATTQKNIEHLMESKEKNLTPLKKYAEIGNILSGKSITNIEESCKWLIDKLEYFIDYTSIPKLSSFGISESDINKISSLSSNKNNPVKLSLEDFKEIIATRL